MFVFAEMDKLILKFKWKFKRPRIVQAFLKKNKVRGLKFANFKIPYKARTVKSVWYSIRIDTDQWN